MDSILIGQKLEALRHCITRIVEKCPANVGLLDPHPQCPTVCRHREPSHRCVRGIRAGNHG